MAASQPRGANRSRRRRSPGHRRIPMRQSPVLRIIGLNESHARLVAPTCAARYLLGPLEACFGGAEVATASPRFRIDYPTSVSSGSDRLCDELRADDDVDLGAFDRSDSLARALGDEIVPRSDDRGARFGVAERPVGDCAPREFRRRTGCLPRRISAGLGRGHDVSAVTAGGRRDKAVLDHPRRAVGMGSGGRSGGTGSEPRSSGNLGRSKDSSARSRFVSSSARVPGRASGGAAGGPAWVDRADLRHRCSAKRWAIDFCVAQLDHVPAFDRRSPSTG